MPGQIVDACCLINVYASGNPLDILRALAGEVFVPDLVRRESLFIRREDDQDQSVLVSQAIDLSDALADGVLRECKLESEQEADEFVRLASILDDGEAACMALAKCRSWMVATDDRKALRIAQSEGVPTITTPEIIKRWAETRSIETVGITDVVRRIERYSRFVPQRNAALFNWWTQHR